MEYFDNAKTGEYVTVLDKDVALAAQGLTDKLAAGLRSLNSSLNGSILLFLTSPKLCGVSLALLPLVGIGAMKMSKYHRKLSEKQRTCESNLLSFALERFANISTVRLNGREKYENNAFQETSKRVFDEAKKSHFAYGAFMAFINMTTNFSLGAVLFVGGGMLASGEMTAGSLTQFAIQSAFVGLGFSGLSTFYSDMVKSLDAAGRVFDQIDQNKSSVTVMTKEASSPSLDRGAAGGGGSIADGEGLIEIKDIFFAYAGRPQQPVLVGLSAVLPRGLTAFAGRSGAGKTTIMAIIAGLYTPHNESGSCGVSLDGRDISQAGSAWLRARVGVVEQQVGMFSGTIGRNIAYGKLDATDDEICRAATAACAHEFISAFKDGYHTEVGENGALLSGGQRARVAIARALIRDPSVLLLDEATAALDQDSEREVIEVLRSLKQSKTVVVFTHSEALMREADQIHVLEGGRVVERGPFAELMARGSAGGRLYAQLQSQ